MQTYNLKSIERKKENEVKRITTASSIILWMLCLKHKTVHFQTLDEQSLSVGEKEEKMIRDEKKRKKKEKFRRLLLLRRHRHRCRLSFILSIYLSTRGQRATSQH